MPFRFFLKRNFLLLLLSIAGLCNLIAQDDMLAQIEYKLFEVQPEISVDEAELIGLRTLKDLNSHYPESWVRTYLDVEFITIHNGIERSAKSTDDRITSEQIKNMASADHRTLVRVKVNYIPENNLEDNEAKIYDFRVAIDPLRSATYPKGEDMMAQYVENNLIKNAPISSFRKYHAAAVKFTVDTNGKIVDVEMYEPTKDESTDRQLINAVCNMPDWKVASYKDGTKVKQEFVLALGDMESCMINVMKLKS